MDPDPVVEMLPADPQLVSGAGDVPILRVQGAVQAKLLGSVERLVKRLVFQQ